MTINVETPPLELPGTALVCALVGPSRTLFEIRTTDDQRRSDSWPSKVTDGKVALYFVDGVQLSREDYQLALTTCASDSYCPGCDEDFEGPPAEVPS